MSDGSSIDETSISGTAAEEEDAEETLQSNSNSRIESEAEEDNKDDRMSNRSNTLDNLGKTDEHHSYKSQSAGTASNDSDKHSTFREGTQRDSAERPPESESVLRAEFGDLNVLEHSRVLKIEDLNEEKRVCKVSSTLLVPPDQKMLRIFLRINFPSGYPGNSPPTFVYGKGIPIFCTAVILKVNGLSHFRHDARLCDPRGTLQVIEVRFAEERGAALLGRRAPPVGLCDRRPRAGRAAIVPVVASGGNR